MAFKCATGEFRFTRVIALLRRKSRSQLITALNTGQIVIYNALCCALTALQAVFIVRLYSKAGQNKTALEFIQDGAKCYLFFFTQSNKIMIGSIMIINKAVI